LHRAKEEWSWFVPGDEHAVPILVLLPKATLQQENVWGIQNPGCGGLTGRSQVRENINIMYAGLIYDVLKECWSNVGAFLLFSEKSSRDIFLPYCFSGIPNYSSNTG